MVFVLKSAEHIPPGPEPFRQDFFPAERQRGKHPPDGGAVLEAAAGKPTAYDEVTSEKVEYGLKLACLRHNSGMLGAVW